MLGYLQKENSMILAIAAGILLALFIWDIYPAICTGIWLLLRFIYKTCLSWIYNKALKPFALLIYEIIQDIIKGLVWFNKSQWYYKLLAFAVLTFICFCDHLWTFWSIILLIYCCFIFRFTVDFFDKITTK